MMNQATGSDAAVLAVRVMVKEPVPGCAAATTMPAMGRCSVANTRLDGVTPPRETVTDLLPPAIVAVPDREKVTLPVTARAVPPEEAACTPVPWAEVPLTPVPWPEVPMTPVPWVEDACTPAPPPELVSTPSTPAAPVPVVDPCTPVPLVELPLTPMPLVEPPPTPIPPPELASSPETPA